MRRDPHNHNLGFIQLKGNAHFNGTDHDCHKETITTKMGTRSHMIRRRLLINAHVEVSILQTEISACLIIKRKVLQNSCIV